MKKKAGKNLTFGKVRLSPNAAVIEQLDGIPVVIEHRLGKGIVLLVNVREYPADTEIRPVYEKLLTELGQNAAAAEAARGWLSTSDTVEFAAYDDKDKRTIYAININWWEEKAEPAKAILHIGGKDYHIKIVREVIHTFKIADSFAVWTGDNETEVLSFDRMGLKVQGIGNVTLRLVGDFSDVLTEGFSARQESEGVWVLNGVLNGITNVKWYLKQSSFE